MNLSCYSFFLLLAQRSTVIFHICHLCKQTSIISKYNLTEKILKKEKQKITQSRHAVMFTYTVAVWNHNKTPLQSSLNDKAEY